MASIENYVEPDEVGGERARELYQYYRPPTLEKSEAVFLPYADTVLQAHAQLAACRLNIQRAMVGLIDKDTLYFVAEATKTLDLEDQDQFDELGDGLYYGAINIPKKGGLQEWTLAQAPIYKDGKIIPAHFEVLDMSHHAHFKDNPHVATDPYFRYYCGVPITTENNVNIGCLFVLDTGLKPAMKLAQLKILTTCARNIMTHLQTVKEAHDKKRAIRTNMLMAEFINPTPIKDQIHFNRDSTNACASDTPKPNVPLANGGGEIINQDLDSDSDDDNEARLAKQMQADAAPLDQINPSRQMVTEADHQKAFDRAAHLIRKSLDLKFGGGVVFLEATTNGHDARETPWQKKHVIYTEESSKNMPFMKQSRTDDSERNISHITTKPQSRTTSQDSIKERVILAAASITDSEDNTLSYGRIDTSYKIRMTPLELRRQVVLGTSHL